MAVSIDKLYGNVAIQNVEIERTFYNRLRMDKLYANVAIRGPDNAVASASGLGTARAQSAVLLVRRPDTDTAAGGWKDNTGGTTSLFAKVAKYFVDDSTYVEGNPGSVGDTLKLKLEPPTFEQNDELYVDYRVSKQPITSTTNVDVTVRLVEGTTTIAEWTHTNVGFTPVSYSQLLTSPQAASITDFTNLYLVMISNPS